MIAPAAPEMPEPVFELIAGALVLDFVNTGSQWRTTGPGRLPTAGRERLNRYDDLVAWARQASVITPELAVALRAAAQANPDEAARTLSRTRRLRAGLQVLFTAAMTGDAAPAAAMTAVNREIGALLGAARLHPTDDGYQLAPPGAIDVIHPALDAPLWPVLQSALDVLTSDDVRAVHACAETTCGWLFLDRTGRRRWCSMASCGTAAKVRRFRARHAHAAESTS
jgi:predicted RNA-binding Zn ribbon-like protein